MERTISRHLVTKQRIYPGLWCHNLANEVKQKKQISLMVVPGCHLDLLAGLHACVSPGLNWFIACSCWHGSAERDITVGTRTVGLAWHPELPQELLLFSLPFVNGEGWVGTCCCHHNPLLATHHHYPSPYAVQNFTQDSW